IWIDLLCVQERERHQLGQLHCALAYDSACRQFGFGRSDRLRGSRHIQRIGKLSQVWDCFEFDHLRKLSGTDRGDRWDGLEREWYARPYQYREPELHHGERI